MITTSNALYINESPIRVYRLLTVTDDANTVQNNPYKYYTYAPGEVATTGLSEEEVHINLLASHLTAYA
jgi:hypothetical protein